MKKCRLSWETPQRCGGVRIDPSLATDPKKRELFTRLADHLTVFASEVERAIVDSTKRSG